jgi:hypothetical protein
MDAGGVFYICPICFQICESAQQCHNHRMVACSSGEPGDERRKPVLDQFGNYASRAPLWYVEAVGWYLPSPSGGVPVKTTGVG